MPYYSPISEQVAYCWNQCIKSSPQKVEETLEFDMISVYDALCSNISTSSEIVSSNKHAVEQPQKERWN